MVLNAWRNSLRRIALAIKTAVIFGGLVLCPRTTQAQELRVVLKSFDPSELISYQGTTVPLGYLTNASSQAAAPRISDNGDIVIQAWVANYPLTVPDQRKILVRVRADGTKEVLARSGVPFAITPTQTLPSITSFDDVRLGALGDVAFGTTLTGSGVSTTNDRAWFVMRDPAVPARFFAREGDLISGSSTTIANFSKVLSSPHSSANPISALVRATTSPQTAVLEIAQNGGAVPIIRDLEQADLSGGYISSSGGSYAENNTVGDFVFVNAILGSTVNGTGLWSYRNGVRRLLARTGTSIPGGIASVPTNLVSIHRTDQTGPLINESGKILFAALTQMAGGSTANGGGLFIINADGTGFETIAANGNDRGLPYGTTIASGDVATGCIVTPTIDANRSFYLTESNTVFFMGSLSNCELSGKTGLFASELSTSGYRVTRSILVNGLPIGSDPLARTVVVSGSSPTALWSAGENVAAWVQLSDGASSNYTLVRYHAGSTQILLQDRGEIPWTFSHGNQDIHLLTMGTLVPTCMMNSLGQMLCLGSVFNTVTQAQNNWAVFTINQQGSPRLVGVSAETMALSDGTNLSVGPFSLLGTEPESLNNQGEFAFRTSVAAAGWSDVVIKGVISEATQCRADVNGDSISSMDDLFAFLSAWFQGTLDESHSNLVADFNHDNTVTMQDLFEFLETWLQGCP